MRAEPFTQPAVLEQIGYLSETLGFAMSCDRRVGSLLAVLAASKPGGNLVEIGTGFGAGAAWLLSGMDDEARLTTVEIDRSNVAIARSQLGGDERVQIVEADAHAWLERYDGIPIDLAFVDWRAGKFAQLDRVVELLAPGGLYVVDDLLPQPTWPDGHERRIGEFFGSWPRTDMAAVPIEWASGLLIAAKLP
ncbi:O-methyltransferase [Glycomyces xiaoerkulensis]|uniref:O-methyltransferase n=1 Tax=Glycomyces xiaoerkulensis TaxID=2038139 RepID=UPI000C25CD8E|nr:class I SAM-dependent methyltransferase [Glycomyces xiaoerkulensis]